MSIGGTFREIQKIIRDDGDVVLGIRYVKVKK